MLSIYLPMCAFVCAHLSVHAEVRGQFTEVSFSFQHVGSGAQNQTILESSSLVGAFIELSSQRYL